MVTYTKESIDTAELYRQYIEVVNSYLDLYDEVGPNREHFKLVLMEKKIAALGLVVANYQHSSCECS